MNQGITTIALYDTLGQDALKYVCNQTELTTIFCDKNCILPLAKLKVEDAKSDNKMMYRVTTVVSFETEIDEKEK